MAVQESLQLVKIFQTYSQDWIKQGLMSHSTYCVRMF